MGEEIQKTYDLFKEHLPMEAELEIVETDQKLISRYLFRATYTSPRTGRKVTITSKGDHLPTRYEELRVHLLVIALTRVEQGRRFSEIAWLEKRARQDEFFNNKTNIRVTTEENKREMLPYDGYA